MPNPGEIKKRFDKISGERGTWEVTWQDVIDYVMPFRTPITSTATPGEIQNVEVFDSTPTNALFRFSASLNSMLTNMSSEWFLLETDDEEANEIPEVRDWLEEMQTVVRHSLENSNFYTEAHEMYLDLGSIGTACMYVSTSRKPDRELHFSTRHIREFYILEDEEGEVDTVYRDIVLTARQIKERWADTMSEDIKKIHDKDPEREFHVLHTVYPRAERDTSKKDNLNMPWISMWMEKENENLLEEGGYEEFPFVTPRWLKSSGEVYGRSPAINSLPDIKTLNKMMETLLIAGEKAVDPPMELPHDGYYGTFDLTPGALNFRKQTNRNESAVPIQLGTNIPLGYDMLQEKRDSISDAFFATQLQIIDKTEMTAQEVRARTQENLKVLGPAFGRLQADFLEKLIARVINILGDSTDSEGVPKLPEAPQQVQGKNLKLRFVSPLAKAQSQGDLESLNYAVSSALQWAQVEPSILDNVDFDMAFRELVDLSGAPRKMLNSPDEIEQIRQQRAQQQQAREAIEQMRGGTEAAKTAAQTDKIAQEIANNAE
jgi:hypothetical protein